METYEKGRPVLKVMVYEHTTLHGKKLTFPYTAPDYVYNHLSGRLWVVLP